MKTIAKIIYSYSILFEFVNVLELIISLLLLLIPQKREWNDYIICLYGGFLFGIIPCFLLLENILVAFILCIFLSFGFIFLHKKIKKTIYIPFGVVVFKVLLVVGITIFAEQYSLNMIEYYLIIMVVSIMFFCVINMSYEFPLKQQYYVTRLFALLELSGVIIQFYKIDYSSFAKELFDSKESVSFFLYLLKVDFLIFDYQYLYIMCFLVLLFIYMVWRKIVT